MGSKALLCLPVSARPEYSHLIMAPDLLLEQLLMNMKIESAGKVLETIRKDLLTHAGSNLGVNAANLDALIIKYANKALEFPVLQPEDSPSGSMSRSHSRASLASLASLVSRQRTASFSLSTAGQPGRHTLIDLASQKPGLKPVRTSMIDLPMAGRGAAALLRVSPKAGVSGSPPQAHPGSLPTSSQLSAGKPSSLSRSPGVPVPGAFIMPAEPPPKDQWVPDSAVTVCMVCKVERFSMFNRRHHCRRCGRVVCGDCSRRRAVVLGTSARTCDDCYKQMFKPKAEVEVQEKLQKLKERLSGGGGSAGDAGSGFVQLSPGPGGSYSDAGEGSVGMPGSVILDQPYILTSDDDLDALTREEFFYEHAPSTSLCISILELLSQPVECGRVMLSLVDDVSKMLKPMKAGMPNPEVDYGLVISMIKYLLFNAKVKFYKCGDSNGVDTCDTYLELVDLLSMLVMANCSYVPTIQQLTKRDTVRRLRDRLIEDERLTLAMEVSTKCGLDSAGVWAAWGLSCLKAGDYAGAREKFSRCLKAPTDKNQTQSPSKLLADILTCLQLAPPPGGSPAQNILAPLKSIQDLIAEPPRRSDDIYQDDPQKQECIHYLRTYGSYLTEVNFYRKHGQLSRAVQFILEKKCSTDVFVEGLLIPCMTSGELSKLNDQMTLKDPTLDKWNVYLTAACKYFIKTKLVNVLYQTQLFMKDYIRAAMTCITYFYQQGATSYADLFSRVQHLLNAKQHLEWYLDQREWQNPSHSRASPGRHTPDWSGSHAGQETVTRVIMTPGEVSKNISTINLQIEVTKFLYRYLDNLEEPTGGATVAKSPKSLGRGSLPTLFGSTKVKAEVVNLVMLSGNNINDGFGLAFRIIQDFRLDASFIYTHVAHQLSKQHKYNYIRQLLGCIKDSGLCTDQSFDEVIGACIRVIADEASEAKEADNLIKLIRIDANKINAYMLCGKLKSAYLIAVKRERVEDVRRIAGAAERAGQAAVKSICDKWLQQRDASS